VVHGKPNPEPYQTALDQLGLNKQDAFVVENAPLGIRSAKAAGLRCIALETSLAREYLKDADYVFSSFSELNHHLIFKYPED
jgi:beta-phosphoglucomutase-like phosphatase (HAD superfamily)